jgi:predicted amidophosphoribosyltransferase
MNKSTKTKDKKKCPECETPYDEITGCDVCNRPTSHEDEPEP